MTANSLGIAVDEPLLIPAVGKDGGAPLASFLGIVGDEHFVANPVAVEGNHCSPNFNQQ